MNYMKNIKEDLKRYIGRYSEPVSELGSSLKRMVQEHTVNIYFEKEKLETTLKEFGVKTSDIYKVCIMTEVTGFKELMECDTNTQQSDIDRFVRNAIEETGFNRVTVLELTCDLALSANIAHDFTSEDFKLEDMKKAYVLPICIFKDELPTLDLEDLSFDPEEQKPNLSLSEIELLQVLSECGIPEAKFFLGYNIFMSEDKNEKGLALIEEAAQEGDLRANIFLGDQYYEKGKYNECYWGKAYNHYTSLGTLGLNKQRKDAVINILNHRDTNRFVFILSILLFVETIILFILKIGSPAYTLHPIVGVISILLSAMLIIRSFLYYKYDEFNSFGRIRSFTFIIFTLWSIYTMVRLLF